MAEARRLFGRLSWPRSLLRSASYLADETIDVNGRPVLCTVVQAKALFPPMPGRTQRQTETFTYWIDKKDAVIWKVLEQEEGPFGGIPAINYARTTTLRLSVSEPNAESAPDELFMFKPIESTQLVKKFTTPRENIGREFEGHPLPAVNLVATDGKAVSVESFRGKPVLLDFWATWCVPCVESLPNLEKLYNETADKGLVVLSIDSDEDAQRATEFLAKRKAPWPNFHLTD